MLNSSGYVVYPFKGKYYTLKQIWRYYVKRGILISEGIYKSEIKEKEAKGKLINEETIIEIVKKCIVRARHMQYSMEKAIIDEFGKETLNEILEARLLEMDKRSEKIRKNISKKNKVYPFKGKYYTSKEIWMYYLKCGISISNTTFREKLKEKEELIDEGAIIEIVKECIIRVRHITPSMEKAIIDEFGKETLNKILEAHDKRSEEIRKAISKKSTVYQFKGKYHTSKEIWMYYLKCGISIQESIFRKEIKEKEAKCELIDEGTIIKIVKECIIRIRHITPSIEKAIIEEFGEKFLNEILEMRNIKRNKQFRDTMKSNVTISEKTINIDSDNSISLVKPYEFEK